MRFHGLKLIKKGGKGGHEKWNDPTDELLHPVIFQGNLKDIKGYQIRNNLGHMNLTMDDLESWLKDSSKAKKRVSKTPSIKQVARVSIAPPQIPKTRRKKTSRGK